MENWQSVLQHSFLSALKKQEKQANLLLTPYRSQWVSRSGPIVDCPDSKIVTPCCPSWSAVIIWSFETVVQYRFPANTSSLDGLFPTTHPTRCC